MRIEDSYDIVIIGAGPSGSTAAKYAAEKASVLVVDKHREIGSPKRCGEGLGIKAFSEFNIPTDKRFLNRAIYGSSVYAPNGTDVTIRQDELMGYVVERKIFDKYLAAEASRAGAKVMADSHASLIKDEGKLTGVRVNHQGKDYDVKAKIIIAADGVESQIARQMGIKTTIDPSDIDSCIEYEMSNIHYNGTDLLHIFVGNDIAPRGYVWIFPKDEDKANIGIGIAGNEPKNAKYYLDQFIAKRPGLAKGSILEVNVGSVPVGGFLDDMVKDNFMVIGDAARQVNPIHGGGLHEVMLGSKLAGEIAGRAIEENDLEILKEYSQKWSGFRGEKLQKVLKVRNFTEKLDDSDLNYLATVWNAEDLIELTRGNYKAVFKKMMKHPKLLKWAKDFI